MAIDEESLVVLLLKERRKLCAFVRTIVRDEHVAEDVFQEVSAIAVRRRQTIHDEAHLMAWLRRTAKFAALNAARARLKHRVLDESVIDALEADWAALDATASSDRLEALHECMKGLTPASRRLLRLRYADGLSGAELAHAVQKELNTVYVALTRIHRALARCVQQRLSGGEEHIGV